MADADLLAAFLGNQTAGAADSNSLLNFQKSIAANDIYKSIAGPVFNAQFDRSTWDPQTSLGVSAGQAFLGTLLNELGQRSESKQLESLATVLPSLYKDPLHTQAPEGVDRGAFASLKIETAAKQAALRDKLMQDLLGTKLDRIKAREGEAGKIEGQNEAYGTTGSENPNSPQYKIKQDQQGLATTLRKELLGNKDVAEFGDVRNRLDVLKKAVKDPTTVADLDFVYGIAKILDPGSVVRGSEGQQVIDSQSIPAATLGYLNKALNGETAIDRSSLLNLAQRHYETRAGRVGSIFDTYENLAKKNNVAPEDVLPFPRDQLKMDKITSPPASVEGRLQQILSDLKSGNLSMESQNRLKEEARMLVEKEKRGGNTMLDTVGKPIA